MSAEFEFNDKLIVFIAEELHNCKYGDFFFNCEHERMRNEVRDKTCTMWLAIDLHKEYFKNSGWVGSLQKMARVTNLPITDYHKLRFWREYFCRYNESQEREEDF
jgi:hypothetical protein